MCGHHGFIILALAWLSLNVNLGAPLLLLSLLHTLQVADLPPAPPPLPFPSLGAARRSLLEYRTVATMTSVDPRLNMMVGAKLKDGMNHDTKDESTIESDVAKPLTTLSAYFITNATSMPPRETCSTTKPVTQVYPWKKPSRMTASPSRMATEPMPKMSETTPSCIERSQMETWRAR